MPGHAESAAHEIIETNPALAAALGLQQPVADSEAARASGSAARWYAEAERQSAVGAQPLPATDPAALRALAAQIEALAQAINTDHDLSVSAKAAAHFLAAALRGEPTSSPATLADMRAAIAAGQPFAHLVAIKNAMGKKSPDREEANRLLREARGWTGDRPIE